MMMNDINDKKDNCYKADQNKETANCIPEIKSIKKKSHNKSKVKLLKSDTKIIQTSKY